MSSGTLHRPRMLEQHYRHQVKPSIDAHVGAMESLFG